MQVGGKHHPWRRFRSLVDWTLQWMSLPDGVVGVTDYAARTVTLARDLSQVERRCTIAHETEHVVAGPVPEFYWPREEARIDQVVARRLIPLEDLVEALRWAHDIHELADELWVDVPTVRVRLVSLTGVEVAAVRARLDA